MGYRILDVNGWSHLHIFLSRVYHVLSLLLCFAFILVFLFGSGWSRR